MPLSDDIPSSPRPNASPEEAVKWYKAQYELLEAELAEFQQSSKDLEAELERDVEAAEKRERQLKDRASNLEYEVEEWKTKHKQAQTEANRAQNALQREITELRDTNRTLQMRLRDTEVANDDFERQQRNTESSLEDMESQYNQTLERSVMLEEEVRNGEQEREALRIETQRLRDEFSDLKIETDITKEKLRKAEKVMGRPRKSFHLEAIPRAASPRSEVSPTTTNASSYSFDTPPTHTASSSGLSETQTPPSPLFSEKSLPAPKPPVTPSIPKTRISIGANTKTPRPSAYATRTPGHVRGASVAVNSRLGPSSASRQSIFKAGEPQQRQLGLPQSSSIMHLKSLQNKMQNLTTRVHNAKSKLPAPTNTPPKASPRGGSALNNHIPSSVTVRSGRKRTGGSTISGAASLPEPEQLTPSYMRSTKSSRPSFGQAQASPSREMAAPPRPSSRASTVSRSSFVPGHSRPGSRASISSLRLGNGVGASFTPNATTDRVRPKSSLSNHGYDGSMDGDDSVLDQQHATPTIRRSTYVKRTSDVGSSIPTPGKRQSLGNFLPAPMNGRRQSSGLAGVQSVEARPPSRMLNDVAEGVTWDGEADETF